MKGNTEIFKSEQKVVPIKYRLFVNYLNAISEKTQEKGITEEELLNDLEQIREEMWNERKKLL